MENQRNVLIGIGILAVVGLGGFFILSSQSGGGESFDPSSNECLGASLSQVPVDFLEGVIMLPNPEETDFDLNVTKAQYTFAEIEDGGFGMFYYPADMDYYVGYELCDTTSNESLSDSVQFATLQVLSEMREGSSGGNSTDFKYELDGEPTIDIASGGSYSLYTLYSEDGSNWTTDSVHSFTID